MRATFGGQDKQIDALKRRKYPFCGGLGYATFRVTALVGN
jgi:hypothetical protein